MRYFQRGSATFLILAAFVLIGISLFAFAVNLSQGAKDEPSPLIQAINNNIKAISQDQKNQILQEDRRISMTLEAQKVNYADKTLDATVTFELPGGVQKNLYDIATGNNIYSCDQSEVCHLKPAYRNMTLTLQLLTASSEPGTNHDYQWTVPLVDIENSLLNHVVRSVTIPMSGFPDLYPQDYYFGDFVLGWTVSGNVTHLVNGKAPTGADQDVYNFEPGNVGEQMNVKVAPLLDGKGKPVQGDFHVSFHRTTQEQLYIYSVALIPLIFAFLFLHLLFFSQHFHHKVFEEFTEALIVAILAVLPLRAVLVPPELTGLTRVDLVLGIGLVLIVGVAIGKYASEIWGSGDMGIAGGPHDDEKLETGSEETHKVRLHESPESELGEASA